MRHLTKFAVHVLRALVNANPTFCMALIAILAIILAGITTNALVTITLATLNERQCTGHQLGGSLGLRPLHKSRRHHLS